MPTFGKVYVCGAEIISVPVLVSGREAPGVNTDRYSQIREFLQYELLTLFLAGALTAVGYDSTLGGLASLLDGTGTYGRVINRVTPTAVRVANAVTVFDAWMIYNLNSGAPDDPTTRSAIDILQAQAIAAGVIWRDAGNIGTELYPRPGRNP